MLTASRYKAAFGGRGSGKSYNFADLMIDDSIRLPGLRSVCIREVQKDLKDSAKRLIEDRLEFHRLGTAQGFTVFRDRIETPGNGVIIFMGMQDHNAESIKSLENFSRAWVEEAQTLSARSLKLLRPTIRAEGSELWFSWNPRRKIDPVDQMFRQGEAPTDAIVVRANWNDNPWFTSVMEQERNDCLNNEPEDYDHVWEGGYVTITQGAYYARHLADAKLQGRITRLTPDPLMVNHLFADIGGTGARSDNFVFWVAQFVGTEVRALNHYEQQGQDLAAHLAWMRGQGYEPGNTKIWLPHDGAQHDKVFSVSYESSFQDAGYEVEVVPNQGKGAAKARIEAGRRLFPSILFDDEGTEAGRAALGWYHERHDEARDIGLGPEHDWSSHSADAFGLMAVAHSIARPKATAPTIDYARWG